MSAARAISCLLACVAAAVGASRAIAQERYSYDVLFKNEWHMSVVFLADKALVKMPNDSLYLLHCKNEGFVIPKGRGDQRVLARDLITGDEFTYTVSYGQTGADHDIKIAAAHFLAEKRDIHEVRFRLNEWGCDLYYKYGNSKSGGVATLRNRSFFSCVRLPLAAFEQQKSSSCN